MSEIFVSYARDDHGRVKPLVEALEARGWSVWWDPELLPGEVFGDVIELALEQARCVIVLWSRTSIRSHFVRDESRRALKRGILVQALIDDVGIPLGFGEHHAAKLLRSRITEGPEFEKLLRGVSSILGQIGLGQRVNPSDGLTYVWIPPSKFMMGCSPGDTRCRDDEKPLREVTISRGFWMGQTQVTQQAYERVVGENPSHFRGPRLPVECVTWDEAGEYAKRVGMRLPTEAEWECAARAGTREARYGDLDAVAWYAENSGKKTHEVGQKQPNAWELYDMLGNIWEWTVDQYPETEFRVLRGGSWVNLPRYIRASNRILVRPDIRSNDIGFRCVGEIL